MRGLTLPFSGERPLSVLCLGAHSDDIEIGCGGTILSLKAAAPVEFHWVVLSACGVRAEEAAASAELFASPAPRRVILKSFRDGYFPYCGSELKDCFEELKTTLNPDLIFTHFRDDAHQDHRLVNELTRNTFRDHLILEYEVPKYDGDMGQPNVFVPLEPNHYRQKVDYLMEAFGSQRTKRWFDPETFLGLMRIRGMESNSPSGYAEGFYGRKVGLQWPA
jgi:LmbE family N-acetylglucosaminyl deacetylase